MKIGISREEGRQRLTSALLADSMEILAAKNLEIADLKEDNALLRARLRLMELRVAMLSGGNIW